MATINRIVAALFALLLAAGSLVTIALASGGLPPERLQLIPWLQAQLAALPVMGTMAMVTAFLVALAVLLFAGLLFVYQFKRHTPREGYLVSEGEAGSFTVQPAAIVSLASFVARTIPGIEEVVCRSRQNDDQRLQVHCRLSCRAGIPLERTAAAYREAFAQQVEEATGLKVGQLHLVARYRNSRPGREKRRYVA